MTPDQLDAFDRKIGTHILTDGCCSIYIFDPDGELPDFCYSIGFNITVKQPEVIVFGLDRDLMTFMVMETLRQCREGLLLTDFARVAGLLEGHDCVVRRVHPSRLELEYFASAIGYYGRVIDAEFADAVQLVWPGAHSGLLPWQEGCTDDVRAAQPALYDPKYSA